MNYEQPDLLEHLAGSYVVGTLRGPARVRFERYCARSQSMRAAVYRWEDRLMPLLDEVGAVIPRDRVWEEISRRIGTPATRTGARAARWRWALAAALALGLVLTVSVRLLSPPLQQLAALGHDRTHPLWSVSRSADSTALMVRALQNVQGDRQKAFELWALPANGSPPVSLGLLPRSGSLKRTLSAAQKAALLRAAHLAVSLEPAGGSPTGAPTGPVLYVAELRVAG
jgi:anti-sigma-K factor RskA